MSDQQATIGGGEVRAVIRFALIVGVLLLLVGIGFYVRNISDVHDWLRQLGRKHHAADEIVVKQRTTVILPGLNEMVKVRVDDIKRGQTADVEIIGPGTEILATKKAARVGDRIAFTHDGKEYDVEVIRYVDKLGSGNTATFRIIALPKDGQPDAKVNLNRSSLQGTWKVEGAPGDNLALLVRECVIGQYDGTRHLVFIKKPGFNEFQPIYELSLEFAKPEEVLCFPGNGKRFPCLYLAKAKKATITFPRISWGNEEVTLLRINAEVHSEVQALIKEWTPQWSTIEGVVAIGSLEKRNRVCEKLSDPEFSDYRMVNGGFRIAFPAGAKIDAADLKDLMAVNAITHLELARTELNDVDLGFIANFKKLDHLSIGHTSVTDAGLQKLNGLKTLFNLNLDGTKITDAGLKELADLPELGFLHLNSCDEVTQAGVTDVMKRFPKLRGVNYKGAFQPQPPQRKPVPPAVQKPNLPEAFTYCLKEKRIIPTSKIPRAVNYLMFADDDKFLWSRR